MPRHSIEDLGPPPPGFRVDERTDDPSGVIKFESLPACVEEDTRRQRAVQVGLARMVDGRRHQRGLELLQMALGAALAGTPQPLSAASRILMRDWRIRVCGWLWSLIDPLETEDCRFFTIVLPKWWVESKRLRKVKAKRFKELLRVALQRAGAAKASGWLYAMLDGEFDGSTEGFTLHYQGLATEGMIPVLRALRKQKQFRRGRSDRRNYPQIWVSRKLKIDRFKKPLPSPITYANKSLWLQHNSRICEDGERRRHGRKHRITGIHRVRHLLWLHRQPVKDLVLLMHLSVIDGELIAGKRGGA